MTISILSSSISLAHIPYRYPHRHLIDVRSPISISHIDIGSYLVTLGLKPRAATSSSVRLTAQFRKFVRESRASTCRGRGGLFMTHTRPKLNLLLLCASICARTLKLIYDMRALPISVRVLLVLNDPYRVTTYDPISIWEIDMGDRYERSDIDGISCHSGPLCVVPHRDGRHAPNRVQTRNNGRGGGGCVEVQALLRSAQLLHRRNGRLLDQ